MVETRRAGQRAVAMLGAALMLAVGLVVAGSPTAAQAISGSEFDPGNIISDAEFYNGDAMTEGEIQSFLNQKIGSCASTLDRCLNVLVHNTNDYPKSESTKTGDLICHAFKGGERLKASTIIYRVQKACGISAKVILVTLQKEQGLTLSKNPSAYNLNYAMGQGCPDHSRCNPKFEGFGNQVYYGTRQLKIYKADKFHHQPGVHNIQYHPNVSCKTLRVNVKNYATMALYNYTPYTPNKAALANLNGLGDSCSSYGNRNFWYFYYSWFGNPTDIRPADVAVSRIGGADRYAVSVNVSKSHFKSTAPVVYVATGTTFSDALSAGPAAAAQGGPLLLVRDTQIPPEVADEIRRLSPDEIIVAGGPGSVSNSVVRELKKMAPSVHRESGADRYEASLNIARGAFGDSGADTAYIATGTNYPDALSSSAAAGSLGAPVVLVRGTDKKLDPQVATLLADLGVTKIVIAGGDASVSPQIESALAALPDISEVKRFGGKDRYVVSGSVNRDAFTSADTVYVSSGTVFPDALSGGPVAALKGSPLYVVRSNCIPKDVLQHIIDLGAKKMILLGGSGTLSSSVAKFSNCKP